MMYDVRTIWDSIGILIVSSSLNLLPQCICTTALSSFSKALFRVFYSSLIDITSDSCPYTPFFFIPFLCLATVHTSTSPCYPAPQHHDSPLVFPFFFFPFLLRFPSSKYGTFPKRMVQIMVMHMGWIWLLRRWVECKWVGYIPHAGEKK